MISLRLSGAEYQGIRVNYRAYGVRNVSEFARLALQRILTGTPASQGAGSQELAALIDRVRALEYLVSHLLEREKAMS